MDSVSENNTPHACDNVDRGLPHERVNELINQAELFNNLLKTNESDKSGNGNGQKVFDAGRSLYEELTELPIGERRALIKLTEAYNHAMVEGDQAMPRLSIDIDADAFIEKLKIVYPIPFSLDAKGVPTAYIGEEFTYDGRGMCAETPTKSFGFTGGNQPRPFEIELPSLW